MDGATLSRAMLGRLSLSRYNALAPGITQALQRANCTTVNRAAMFCAQVGTESGGLQWMEELASGAEYEGRKDLGNTHPGDGVRFKGRGPIQITGRTNYTSLSKWAHSKGYVPTATYFVDNPTQLSLAQYVWLGPVWYWTVARNMNSYADRGDIRGATLAVNGGTNGLADRTNRWNVCRAIGSKLLTGGAPVVVDYTADLAHWFTAAQMKLWQKKIGTTADGIVGINTLNATQKFLGVHVDGVIGPDTIRALQKWAGMTGSEVDGDLGPKTAAAVVKKLGTATPPKPAPLPTLKKGSTGAQVKTVQGFLLKQFSAYAVPIKTSGGADGRFGDGTVAVVKEFQKRSGLTADGVIGPKTWAALRKNGLKI